MRRRIGTFIAWAAATLASIVLATYAVSSVRDEVTDRPSPLSSSVVTVAVRDAVAASTSTPAPTTSPSAASAPTTTAAPNTTTLAPAGTSTTTSPTTTTSTTASPSSTTTSTTTTAAPSDEYFKSYQLVGGWVRLRVVGEDVFLNGAVPSSGYSLEVEKDGPDSVVVEFDNGSQESKLHAEVSDGELRVETEEE